LVVLPTGLGKTIIAVMVAAKRLEKHPNGKILVVAPTRPLVVQHKRTFEEFLTPHTVAVFTGMVSINNRKKLWDESQIIFATPQTIENDLMRGLDLSDVSLIVFDEAHRAVGTYSYIPIAESYCRRAKNPLVLGLTASPSSSIEKIEEIKKNLGIRRVEARTEHDRDVKKYVQDVQVDWLRIELPQEFNKVQGLIEDVLASEISELKRYGYIESKQLKKVNKRVLLAIQAEIRKEITSGMDSYQQASVIASAIKINHAIELLETQGTAALDEYFKRLVKQDSKAVKTLLKDERLTTAIKLVHDMRVLGMDHPKLGKLVEIVSAYKGKKVLIFTQYRDTVRKIIEKLNEADILANEFIGQMRRGTRDGMSQKKQIEILERFREGKYTALVATSVAEEGLDIPRVDLVVFYEPIPSEIRTIQRRGRTGRGAAGRVVVLIAKDTRDEGYYWASVHKERKMGELVRKMRDEAKDEVASGPGQQTILSYTKEDFTGGGIKIFVDVRERNSRILSALKDKAVIELRQLPVGDYILSDRVVVERKTIDDFLQSLIEGRLLSQATELSRNFPHPLMILEGEVDLYSRRGIHPNAVRGALASLAIDHGISILPSKNEEDTAGILYAIAKREQEDEGRIVALRGEKKPMTLRERQQFVIESLPNVSAVLARRLLEELGSVENVVKAGANELQGIDGIGEGRAEEIKKVVKSRYTPGI
jgi:Fanconi anemia group M protein